MAKKIYARTDLYYPLRFDHIDVVSNFAVPVICRSQKIRDALVSACDGVVEIRPIVGGDMTRQPFFGTYVKQKHTRIVNAQLVHEQGLYFGNNPDMTKKDMDTIIKLFTQIKI